MSTTSTERARALALKVRSIEAPSGVFVVEAKWLDDVATTLEAMAATLPVVIESLDEYRTRLATAEKERDKAQANYRFMVDRAADEKLDGYRELGARAATAEKERDEARAALRGAVVAMEDMQCLCPSTARRASHKASVAAAKAALGEEEKE